MLVGRFWFFHHLNSWFMQFWSSSVVDQLGPLLKHQIRPESMRGVLSSAAVTRWRTRRNLTAIRWYATYGSPHRKPGVNKEAIHRRSGKFSPTGAKTPLQSAPGVTRQRQACGPGPSSLSSSSSAWARTAQRDAAETQPADKKKNKKTKHITGGLLLKYTLILTVLLERISM